MRDLDISANDLVRGLLRIADDGRVCILDSCGVGYLKSHLLIAGLDPVETMEVRSEDPVETLNEIDDVVSSHKAAIFTLSYDFGRKLQGIPSKHSSDDEPDAFIALFDSLIVHDYDSATTTLIGEADKFDRLLDNAAFASAPSASATSASSNFNHDDYIAAIEAIKERIRDGDTYQTNLTRQITAELPSDLTPETIFWRLRSDHPAVFSSLIKREGSSVVSASPERFFKIENGRISASPIKGTRPRGATPGEDEDLREELASSNKDRAENTMIVDLLRNDLGRVCEFGSVQVESLCEIEQHPSLFHMVSTISGTLRDDACFADVLKALFPCGSVTGAPKISTMNIIDELETTRRGLSMGAIGYHIPTSFGIGESTDLSVAIRTMVIRKGTATFNVGGGIVIDSDPEKEWEETIVKSRALLNSLGILDR